MKACYIEGMSFDYYRLNIPDKDIHGGLFDILRGLVENGYSTFYVLLNDGIGYFAASFLVRLRRELGRDIQIRSVQPSMSSSFPRISKPMQDTILPCIMDIDAVYKEVSLMLLIDVPEPFCTYDAKVINLSQRELALRNKDCL